VAFSGITEPTRTVRDGPFRGTVIPVTADDNVLLMLDFGDSTFAVVDGTFNVNAARGPKLEIFGREGTINLSGAPYGGDGPALELYRVDAGRWEAPDLASNDRLRSLHRAVLVDHLADCVRDGVPPVLSLDHARHVLEIMLMAQESARQGVAIPLTTTFDHSGGSA
jgi:predicted dehydrogenase